MFGELRCYALILTLLLALYVWCLTGFLADVGGFELSVMSRPQQNDKQSEHECTID